MFRISAMVKRSVAPKAIRDIEKRIVEPSVNPRV